jgi:hypothetical protein
MPNKVSDNKVDGTEFEAFFIVGVVAITVCGAWMALYINIGIMKVAIRISSLMSDIVLMDAIWQQLGHERV